MKIQIDGVDLIEIDAVAETVLLDDLVDFKQWLYDAIAGKIGSSSIRFRQRWDQVLLNDPAVKSIPTDKGEYVTTVKNRKDYKNRKDRDKEENDKQNNGNGNKPV